MNFLPNEILLNIFGRIKFFKSSAAVCQRWKTLLEESRIFYKLNFVECRENVEFLGAMMSSKRRYKELNFVVSPENLQYVLETIVNNSETVEMINVEVNQNAKRALRNFVLPSLGKFKPARIKDDLVKLDQLKVFCFSTSDFSDFKLLHDTFDLSIFSHIILEQMVNRGKQWKSHRVADARLVFPNFVDSQDFTAHTNILKMRLKTFDLESLFSMIPAIFGQFINFLCFAIFIVLTFPLAGLYFLFSRLFS